MTQYQIYYGGMPPKIEREHHHKEWDDVVEKIDQMDTPISEIINGKPDHKLSEWACVEIFGQMPARRLQSTLTGKKDWSRDCTVETRTNNIPGTPSDIWQVWVRKAKKI